MPMISSISWLTLSVVGRRQVDLVDDRHDLQALLDRGVAVGHALGLDTLGCVDHQQGAFARPRANGTLHRRSRRGPGVSIMLSW